MVVAVIQLWKSILDIFLFYSPSSILFDMIMSIVFLFCSSKLTLWCFTLCQALCMNFGKIIVFWINKWLYPSLLPFNFFLGGWYLELKKLVEKIICKILSIITLSSTQRVVSHLYLTWSAKSFRYSEYKINLLLILFWILLINRQTF